MALRAIKRQTLVGVPYSDFKHCISQYIHSTWQDDWNGAVVNKLHAVKPVMGDWQCSTTGVTKAVVCAILSVGWCI